jgi:hypothetical protein
VHDCDALLRVHSGQKRWARSQVRLQKPRQHCLMSNEQVFRLTLRPHVTVNALPHYFAGCVAGAATAH